MQTLLNSADTERVDAFHEILSTLAGALDIRDVFKHLSTVVSRIVEHDEADLALSTEDGYHFRLYASTMEGEPALVCPDSYWAVQGALETRIFGEGFCPDRGFHSALRVPVSLNGEAIGVLALLSRRRDAYSPRELAIAVQVADYVAIALSHQRLAEAARLAAVQRDRAESLESSVELLRAIAGVLDIRTVFPRVSEIANKVLPHDRMTMSFDNGREIVVQAATGGEGPHPDRIKLTSQFRNRDEDFFIVDDIESTPLPIVEPADLSEQIVAAGYRSFLAINATARDQVLGLAFWAKRPHAFSREDVPVARRIVTHVALAVSHEQLAESARQMAEMRARAERLELRVKTLAEELDSKAGRGRAVGESAEWKDVLKKAGQVATTDTTVLLTGESGTGKEVVARLIHRASARKDGPFVALNCAALPEQLLESELFGHERGAFTGAQQAKPGQIELASGGVLFLDEVSEMSLPAQAKFLRVLQEREFQRLGATRLLKAQIRVIAATNRDLRRAVELGTFREDLFYRLQVFDIDIPPLRSRREDILPLAEAFLQEIGKSFGRPPAGLTRDAREALLDHDWPGNVRELRNALERAAILCEGGLITAEHLSLQQPPRRTPAGSPGTQGTSTQGTSETPEKMSSNLSKVERETIEHVMRETRGNKSRAAKRLGLSRTQLYVRLRKYDLEGVGSKS